MRKRKSIVIRDSKIKLYLLIENFDIRRSSSISNSHGASSVRRLAEGETAERD